MVVFTPTQKNTCALSPHNIHKWWCPHLLRRTPVLCLHTTSTNGGVRTYSEEDLCFVSTQYPQMARTYTCSKDGLGVISIQYPQMAQTYTCSKAGLGVISIQYPQLEVYIYLFKGRPGRHLHTISTTGSVHILVQRPAWASSLYNIHNWKCTYTCSKAGLGVISIQYPQLEVYIYLFKGRPGRHLYTISTTGGAHILVQRPAWASSLYNIHNWRCIYTCSKDNLVIAAIQSPQMTKYPYLFKGQLTHRYRCRTISTNDEVPTPLQRTTQIPLSYNIHK